MSHTLLGDSRLFTLLARIDEELAAETRTAGCPICGATLHAADYPRKPRGLPPESSRDLFVHRRSFCCAADG